jgi:quinol monooxygenase YgiN
MFIALYEFKVKTGFEKQFEENWAIVTEFIYTTRGSLGSRLHRDQDGTYVAYAQWPSEEQYNVEIPLPTAGLTARSLMKDACESQTVLKLMSVATDLFKN